MYTSSVVSDNHWMSFANTFLAENDAWIFPVMVNEFVFFTYKKWPKIFSVYRQWEAIEDWKREDLI